MFAKSTHLQIISQKSTQKHSKLSIVNIREKPVICLVVTSRDVTLGSSAKAFAPVYFRFLAAINELYILPGTETRKPFCRIFVTLRKFKSCFILLKME